MVGSAASASSGDPHDMLPSVARPGWTTDPHWLPILPLADRLSADLWLAARAGVEHLYTVGGHAIRAMEHQAVWHQVTRAGRLVLLEQGLAAAFEPPRGHFLWRLRDPIEHFGAVTELTARQMFRFSGALLKPATKSKGTRLAEFIPAWPSGAEAIVEVKALRQAAAMREADRIVTQTHFALMRHSAEIVGFCGRVSWCEDILESTLDNAAILVAACFALAEAKALCTDARPHAVPIEGIGTLHLTPDPSCHTLRIEDLDGYGPSDEAIYRRLLRPMQTAIEQIASHPELPGIVVFDVDACGMARNALHLLEAWAAQQAQLGTIIVVEREHTATASYGNVRFLRGPRAHEVVDVCNAFECCDAGHIHYQPLCTPASPCESHFWLARAA